MTGDSVNSPNTSNHLHKSLHQVASIVYPTSYGSLLGSSVPQASELDNTPCVFLLLP
jgi:hypothetical protein